MDFWFVVTALAVLPAKAATTNLFTNEPYVRNFWPGSRPAAIGPDEKWIEISLRQQTLIAHEGDTPVFATLVSTGRRDYETETGLYRI